MGRGVPASPQNALDTVKVDVGSMALDVLAGLARTIERFRPAIFACVPAAQATALAGWFEGKRYRCVWSYTRHPREEHCIFLPEGHPRLQAV